MLDYTFNQDLRYTAALSVEQLKYFYRDAFSRLNMSVAYKSLFSMMWYASLPCFDINGVTSQDEGDAEYIRSCSWKGKQIPCSTIFRQFPTEMAMCCTFNMKSADEAFNSIAYVDVVKKMQAGDLNRTFAPTATFNSDRSDFQPESSLQKGLELVLDAHYDQSAIGTVFYESLVMII